MKQVYLRIPALPTLLRTKGEIVKNKTIIICCAALLLVSVSACAQKTDNKESAPETTAAVTSFQPTTAAETTAKPTELKAEVIVPEHTVPDIDGKRSNPDDPSDATGFVSVSEYIPDAMLDIRYYSTYNFIGDRVNGYEEPIAILSNETAQALKNAADSLREKGYRIKIFDAYRPQSAVDHFASWAKDTGDTRMKKYFYPELDKSVLFDYGYIAYYSGHSRGSSVDLTIFDMDSGKDVDMGGTFDFFGELSHPDYRGITDEQYKNRMILRDAMVNSGFNPIATEWWHFSLANEPYPNTYFTFPVSTGSLKYHTKHTESKG